MSAFNGGEQNASRNAQTAVIRVIGDTSKYDLEFAVKTVAVSSCERTDIIPDSIGYVSADSLEDFVAYRELLFQDTNFLKGTDGKLVSPILVNPDDQCWAITDGYKLAYRDKSGVARMLPLFEATLEEIRAIQAGK